MLKLDKKNFFIPSISPGMVGMVEEGHFSMIWIQFLIGHAFSSAARNFHL
jgi:hypothetical protein